jgi:hypothetical protein
LDDGLSSLKEQRPCEPITPPRVPYLFFSSASLSFGFFFRFSVKQKNTIQKAIQYYSLPCRVLVSSSATTIKYLAVTTPRTTTSERSSYHRSKKDMVSTTSAVHNVHRTLTTAINPQAQPSQPTSPVASHISVPSSPSQTVRPLSFLTGVVAAES